MNIEAVDIIFCSLEAIAKLELAERELFLNPKTETRNFFNNQILKLFIFNFLNLATVKFTLVFANSHKYSSLLDNVPSLSDISARVKPTELFFIKSSAISIKGSNQIFITAIGSSPSSACSRSICLYLAAISSALSKTF